jgi:hypothetical protein
MKKRRLRGMLAAVGEHVWIELIKAISDSAFIASPALFTQDLKI